MRYIVFNLRFGLVREDFEHIYDFLGKARLSFVV